MRWLVTRHPGTKQWAKDSGLAFDRHVEHLDVDDVQEGDIVMGSLPINLAAAVCGRGGRYFHVTLALSRDERGTELPASTLFERAITLEEYVVVRPGVCLPDR